MAKSSGLARWLGAALLVGAAMMPIQHADAQERGQARSMVVSRYCIVAAESPLAAQAGVEILERGGNAVDAAIAGNAMMGVIAPMRSEERRVGKECRSRWSPYHLKKKKKSKMKRE